MVAFSSRSHQLLLDLLHFLKLNLWHSDLTLSPPSFSDRLHQISAQHSSPKHIPSPDCLPSPRSRKYDTPPNDRARNAIHRKEQAEEAMMTGAKTLRPSTNHIPPPSNRQPITTLSPSAPPKRCDTLALPTRQSSPQPGDPLQRTALAPYLHPSADIQSMRARARAGAALFRLVAWARRRTGLGAALDKAGPGGLVWTGWCL